MVTASALMLAFIRQAADRRVEAERHFKDALLLGRNSDLSLASIAEAAGLSVSRVHSIIEEEKLQAYSAHSAVATDDVVIVAARIAYDDYVHYHAYICQDRRSFRDVIRMGFYRHGRIEPHFPAIRAVEEHVPFSKEHAEHLRATGSRIDGEIADLIENAPSYYRRYEGEPHKVFLLTPPEDPQTLVLPRPILHETAGRGSAFTMGQRYVSEAALETNAGTTAGL